MKTIFKRLAVLTIMTVAAACAKEPVGTGSSTESVDNAGETVFTASISDVMGTKVAISKTGKLTWDATDAIGVFDTDGGYYKLTLSSGAGTNTATFSGKIPEGKTLLCALFPYYGLSPKYENDNLLLTLPDRYDLSNSPNVAVPMFGKFSDEDKLSFTHLCGVIRFNIRNYPSTASRLRFVSSDKAIHGSYQISKSEIESVAAPELVAAAGSTEAERTTFVYKPASGEYGKDAVIDVVVPTGTYDDFTVALLNDSWKVMTSQNVTNAANVVRRKGLLDIPEVYTSVCVQDFEGTWSANNTEQTANPLKTSLNASEKVIRMTSTAYFGVPTPDNPAPFAGLRASAKVVSCKYYITAGAGTVVPAMRNGYSPNTYLIPNRINGVECTADNYSTLFVSDDWNVLEWDLAAAPGNNGIFFRPCCDAAGESVNIPAGADIYMDDVKVLL